MNFEISEYMFSKIWEIFLPKHNNITLGIIKNIEKINKAVAVELLEQPIIHRFPVIHRIPPVNFIDKTLISPIINRLPIIEPIEPIIEYRKPVIEVQDSVIEVSHLNIKKIIDMLINQKTENNIKSPYQIGGFCDLRGIQPHEFLQALNRIKLYENTEIYVILVKPKDFQVDTKDLLGSPDLLEFVILDGKPILIKIIQSKFHLESTLNPGNFNRFFFKYNVIINEVYYGFGIRSQLIKSEILLQNHVSINPTYDSTLVNFENCVYVENSLAKDYFYVRDLLDKHKNKISQLGDINEIVTKDLVPQVKNHTLSKINEALVNKEDVHDLHLEYYNLKGNAELVNEIKNNRIKE